MKKHFTLSREKKIELNNQERNTFNKKYIDSFKCMFDGCDQKAIFSHSISDSISIKMISENDHVAKIISKDDSSDLCRKFEWGKISHKDALVFKGFCSQHDSSIFKSIDNNTLNNTNDLLLFIYRALCYQMYNLKIASDKYSQCYKSILNGVDGASLSHLYDDYNIILDLVNSVKRLYDKCLCNTLTSRCYDFDSIVNVWFKKLSYQIPVAMNNWHSLRLNNGNISGVLVCVIPFETSTEILIMYPSTVSSSLKNRIKTVFGNDLLLLDLIEKSMACCENWVIKPSVIKAEKKTVLLNDLYYMVTNTNLFEPYDMSIFDEIRKALIEKIELKEEQKISELNRINNIPQRNIEDLRVSFDEKMKSATDRAIDPIISQLINKS